MLKRMKTLPYILTPRSALRFCVMLAAVFIFLVLAQCASPPVLVRDSQEFKVDEISPDIPFADPEIIRLHEANLSQRYLIGAGDVVEIDVWNREKLSGEHIVGPYGKITMPMVGVFKIGDMTRENASAAITELYRRYYDDPIVTVKILKYMNNKVYVFGKVRAPGVMHFEGEGTLLEALSMAGGLPTGDKTIFLSKCYIVRGKEQIIWVDLQQLLQKANMKLNVRLANNDIIYIPESMDASVFVMGQVQNPGSYVIQITGISVLDALNLAGGPTEDGNINQVRLIRAIKDKEGVKVIDLEKMLSKGDFSENYLLKDDDILYIPRKGIASFNYYLRQIDPFLRTFISGIVIHEAVKK